MTDTIPHGTSSGYMRHRCRCDICRAAEVARQRAFRARRRAERLAAGEALDGTMPVTIRGERYPSVRAAAAAIGVSPNTISSHLSKYGHADFAGLGRKGRKFPSVGGHRAIPISLFGRDFPHIKAAAKYMGVSYGILLKDVRDGTVSRRGERYLAALMQADRRAA